MILNGILFTCGILASAEALCQKVIYLDSCENEIERSKYAITRTISRAPNLCYEFEDRYQDGKMFTWGKSNDSKGLVKLGHYVWYNNDGHILAVSTYDKYGRNPKWIYYDENEKETSIDSLLIHVPVVSYMKGKFRHSGKCLFYAKHGKWIQVSIDKKDTVVTNFKHGVLIENGNHLKGKRPKN